MPFISRQQLEAFKATAESLQRELEKAKDHAYLVGVERVGRENVFTFARGTEMIEVRTMGLLSDDLPSWKAKLLR